MNKNDAIDLFINACAHIPVLPLQSNTLSGALHPTPTQHGTKVLRPCAENCPRIQKEVSNPESFILYVLRIQVRSEFKCQNLQSIQLQINARNLTDPI